MPLLAAHEPPEHPDPLRAGQDEIDASQCAINL